MKSEDIDKMIWKQSKNGFFFLSNPSFFLRVRELNSFPFGSHTCCLRMILWYFVRSLMIS